MFGIFDIIGLLFKLAFYWVIFGLIFAFIAWTNKEDFSKKDFKIAIAFGPLPLILIVVSYVLSYYDISLSSIFSRLNKKLEGSKKLYEECKNKVPSVKDAKDAYESCKSKLPDVKETYESSKKKIPSREEVLDYCKSKLDGPRKAFDYLKKKFAKEKKEEENEEEKK